MVAMPLTQPQLHIKISRLYNGVMWIHSNSRVDPGLISGRGVRCVKEVVRFADFVSFFLNIPWN